MTCDFETDPAIQKALDWTEEFKRGEIESLDYAIPDACDISDPMRKALIPPLHRTALERGRWVLLANETVSWFSMTDPQCGFDPIAREDRNQGRRCSEESGHNLEVSSVFGVRKRSARGDAD